MYVCMSMCLYVYVYMYMYMYLSVRNQGAWTQVEVVANLLPLLFEAAASSEPEAEASEEADVVVVAKP